MAPWLCGAAALVHDARFDPQERLAVLAEERPEVLCMAPTEYRLLAKRTALEVPDSLRRLVAAGEALDPAVLHAWHAATGLWVRDGYGQTETGQLTAPPEGTDPVPGSMGRPLPGFGLDVHDAEPGDEVGELVIADPSTVPTFFLGYLDAETGAPVPHEGVWRTGDRVRRDPSTGDLFFVGRTDDVIVSSGYRIGPFEVESVLVEHPAVAEAAAVAAPDPERGSIVRAVVVLRDGMRRRRSSSPSCRRMRGRGRRPTSTPRRIDFVDELPKTASGKVRRALLRSTGRSVLLVDADLGGGARVAAGRDERHLELAGFGGEALCHGGREASPSGDVAGRGAGDVGLGEDPVARSLGDLELECARDGAGTRTSK